MSINSFVASLEQKFKSRGTTLAHYGVKGMKWGQVKITELDSPRETKTPELSKNPIIRARQEARIKAKADAIAERDKKLSAIKEEYDAKFSELATRIEAKLKQLEGSIRETYGKSQQTKGMMKDQLGKSKSKVENQARQEASMIKKNLQEALNKARGDYQAAMSTKK